MKGVLSAIVEADPNVLSTEDLLTFAAERLAKYKLRSVEYVDEPLEMTQERCGEAP